MIIVLLFYIFITFVSTTYQIMKTLTTWQTSFALLLLQHKRCEKKPNTLTSDF